MEVGNITLDPTSIWAYQHNMRISFVAALSTLLSLTATQCDASSLRQTSNDADPVSLTVLTEALCPYCELLIRDDVTTAMAQLGPSVMNLEVIPFGNAEMTSETSVECQHGLGECDANVYELCAIQLYPDPVEYLPFLTCLSQKLHPDFDNTTIPECPFRSCAKEAHMSWPSIQDCHAQEYYSVLQKAADRTPDHQYVPWIILEGEHIERNEDFDLVVILCEAYEKKGGSYPACTGLSSSRKEQGDLDKDQDEVHTEHSFLPVSFAHHVPTILSQPYPFDQEKEE